MNKKILLKYFCAFFYGSSAVFASSCGQPCNGIGQNGLYQIDLEHQVMVISVHHKRYNKLRSILKELRLKSGLTQVQIANLLFMEQSNVSKVERGERYIDTLFFIDYCKACGAVPADVIAKVDESEH